MNGAVNSFSRLLIHSRYIDIDLSSERTSRDKTILPSIMEPVTDPSIQEQAPECLATRSDDTEFCLLIKVNDHTAETVQR